MTFPHKKGITQDVVRNIIRIMDMYTPGCISNADFESRLKQKEIKDAVKIGPTSSESCQLKTYQDAHSILHKIRGSRLVAVDSKPRYIQEKLGQNAHSDADPEI